MNNYEEISKIRIQTSWDYAKQQVDIHCRLYLQIFAVLLTIGFSIIVAGLTEVLKPYSPVTTIVGSFLIFISVLYVMKVRDLTNELEEYYIFILDELEKLIND